MFKEIEAALALEAEALARHGCAFRIAALEGGVLLLDAVAGGRITMLFRAFLRLPLDTDIWLASGDTGLHRWRIEPDRRAVLLANSAVHLAV